MTESAPEADSAYPGTPQLKLRIMPSQGASFDHVVEAETLVIGRSSTSDLVLPDRFLSGIRRSTAPTAGDPAGW